MPARNNRLILRIILGSVLAAGLLGACVASSLITIDPASLAIPGLNSQADWVDAASLVADQLLQFFLGWTHSPG